MTDPNLRLPTSEGSMPPIPDKLYFRIGEVAALCRVPGYVLRFWQSEFPQLRPGKSGTGQRLYRRRDVETALRIKHLLHGEGYTIAGAKNVLAGKPPARPQVLLGAAGERAEVQHANPTSLAQIRAELQELLLLLERKPVPGERVSPALQLVPGKPPQK